MNWWLQHISIIKNNLNNKIRLEILWEHDYDANNETYHTKTNNDNDNKSVVIYVQEETQESFWVNTSLFSILSIKLIGKTSNVNMNCYNEARMLALLTVGTFS